MQNGSHNKDIVNDIQNRRISYSLFEDQNVECYPRLPMKGDPETEGQEVSEVLDQNWREICLLLMLNPKG